MKPEDEFVHILRTVLGHPEEFIALHAPVFGETERQLILDCIETGWVSSVGKYVNQFEAELAEFCGVHRAIAVVNGTAALHICLILAGIQPGDEVIMPSMTFVASANAANMHGAHPHFVDVEPSTLGLDPDKLSFRLEQIGVPKVNGLFNRETGRRIACVLPMHCYGHPVRLDELAQVCQKYNLPLIEDAAESLGSFYKGRHTGSYGMVSAVSFNGNKVITTGGGGAILTDDEGLADRAKHLTTTAKVPHRWDFVHDERAYNYRMPNLNAALGVAQLRQLPAFLKAKRQLAVCYERAFSSCSWGELVVEPEHCQSNYWLSTIRLKTADPSLRDRLLKASNDAGLMTRPIWKPMHQLKIYESSPHGDLSTTESLARILINIPSGVSHVANSNFPIAL